jgi:hypothetical protein
MVEAPFPSGGMFAGTVPDLANSLARGVCFTTWSDRFQAQGREEFWRLEDH